METKKGGFKIILDSFHQTSKGDNSDTIGKFIDNDGSDLFILNFM
jgi:hypothetical protein